MNDQHLRQMRMTMNPLPSSAVVISVVNWKGGVGKTTTSVNLAAALAEVGDVLLVDWDSQGSATESLGYAPESLEGRTIYHLLLGSSTWDDILLEHPSGIHLAPADKRLADAGVSLAQTAHQDPEVDWRALLRDPLAEMRDRYHWIIIDTLPSYGPLSVCSLAAADYLLIPVEPEFLALRGLRRMLQVHRAAQQYNPGLKVAGVVLSRVARTRHAREAEAHIRGQLGALVFKSVIPRSIRVADASTAGQSILAYAPNHPAAHQFRTLSEEVIARVQEPTSDQ